MVLKDLHCDVPNEVEQQQQPSSFNAILSMSFASYVM